MRDLKRLARAMSDEFNLIVLLQLARDSEERFTRDELVKVLNFPREYVGPINNSLVHLEAADLVKFENGRYRINLEESFGHKLRDFIIEYATGTNVKS